MTDKIVLYSDPSFNHPDVPAGSIDGAYDNELLPGTKIDLNEMVCSALVSPAGNAFYAGECEHYLCAESLGFNDVDDAMRNGWAHIAVGAYTDISCDSRFTEAQIRTITEMYFTAVMSETARCRDFVRYFIAFAKSEGIDL